MSHYASIVMLALIVAGACAAETPAVSQDSQKDTVGSQQPVACSVAIDFGQSAGRLRPLNGVGNGPAVWGLPVSDLEGYHAQAGFSSVRLHDCHYPGVDVVDVSSIFPIFTADVDDPNCYCFAKTDAYLAPIVKNGAQITYRLGVSIEHRSRFNIHPPKDFAKWARICVNIIRHYNEGWANGHRYNIRYWEIWNEPEIETMWSGTQQQYFELYEVAAKAIKAHDPSLKVGGPVACSMGSGIVRPFVTYCRDRKLPLDFLAWHCYAGSLQEMVQFAAKARALLDENGYKQAESHITEWHYFCFDWGEIHGRLASREKAAALRAKHDFMRGPKAAAFVASAMMLLQDSPVDMMNYYTADTLCWSMFDADGFPGKVYYAFVAFNHLLKTPNRVACVWTGARPPEVTICAGLSDDRRTASALIGNLGRTPRHVEIILRHLPQQAPTRVETFLVDTTHEFTRVHETSLTLEEPVLRLSLPGDSVSFIRCGARSLK